MPLVSQVESLKLDVMQMAAMLGPREMLLCDERSGEHQHYYYHIILKNPFYEGLPSTLKPINDPCALFIHAIFFT